MKMRHKNLSMVNLQLFDDKKITQLILESVSNYEMKLICVKSSQSPIKSAYDFCSAMNNRL